MQSYHVKSSQIVFSKLCVSYYIQILNLYKNFILKAGKTEVKKYKWITNLIDVLTALFQTQRLDEKTSKNNNF